MSVKLRIENTYECGRHSEAEVTVEDPHDEESELTWWEAIVAPLTGDGHSCGSREDALYTATVIESDHGRVKPGDTQEWQG